MYYAEKLIDGKWYWKAHPDSKWIEFTIPGYVNKIADMQREMNARDEYINSINGGQAT